MQLIGLCSCTRILVQTKVNAYRSLYA